MNEPKRPLSTVAKGIPPRLHEPKSTAKARTSKPKKSGKRVASESESESDLSKEELVKKTKGKKRQRIDSGPEVEVELVDRDAEPAEKEVEEVDAGSDSGQDDQEEVSKDSWATLCKNSPIPRRMTSMNINTDLTSKNSLQKRS